MIASSEPHDQTMKSQYDFKKGIGARLFCVGLTKECIFTAALKMQAAKLHVVFYASYYRLAPY